MLIVHVMFSIGGEAFCSVYARLAFHGPIYYCVKQTYVVAHPINETLLRIISVAPFAFILYPMLILKMTILLTGYLFDDNGFAAGSIT